MSTLLTITDNLSGYGQTMTADEVVMTLAPWYPEAPAEVTDAVAAIQTHALRGEWEKIGPLEAFLDVTVERTACDECGKPATQTIVPADPQAFTWPVCDRHFAEVQAEDEAEGEALAEATPKRTVDLGHTSTPLADFIGMTAEVETSEGVVRGVVEAHPHETTQLAVRLPDGRWAATGPRLTLVQS